MVGEKASEIRAKAKEKKEKVIKHFGKELMQKEEKANQKSERWQKRKPLFVLRMKFAK